LNWHGEFKTMPDDRLPVHLRAPGDTAQHWSDDTTRIREISSSPKGFPARKRFVEQSSCQRLYRVHAAPVRYPSEDEL
jgi:hypothetical protein